VDIGEHGGITTRCPSRQCVHAIFYAIGLNPEQLELEYEHFAVHRVIIGYQDAWAVTRRGGNVYQ
jgi:hypothetical protein